MTVTAHWDDEPRGWVNDRRTGEPTDWHVQARCGRPRCRAHLVHNVSDQGDQANLHAGFIFDSDRQLYRLSNRATALWQRARMQGESWEHFWPSARHVRAPKADLDDVRLDRMPRLPVTLPATVLCPLCGFVNTVPKIPDMAARTLRWRERYGTLGLTKKQLERRPPTTG